MSRWHLRSGLESGVTLTELMMGIGITGILSLGVATFLSQQNLTVNELKYTMNIQSIAHRIERAAARPDVIRASASYSTKEGNRKLKACIDGPMLTSAGTAPHDDPCTATDPEEQIPFELILPPNSSSPKKEDILSNIIAGSEDQPVYYSLRDNGQCGARMKTIRGDCPLIAKAYFWASCPPTTSYLGSKDASDSSNPTPDFAPESCPVAQTIHVRYQVVHLFELQNLESTKITKVRKQLPSVPPDSRFWKNKQKKIMSTFGAMSTDVSIIPQDGTFRYECSPNYTMTSVKDGKPICECLYPFNFIKGALGEVCIAQEQKCKSHQRYRGTGEKGDIKCVDVNCVPKVDINDGCGYGGWIESIQPINANAGNPDATTENSCIASLCSIDKNGGTCQIQVACKTTMTCCYETKPP